jgi:hypothetical protein
MRVLVALFFVVFLCYAPVYGATLNVPDEYPTIQAAVDAALDGDRILVDEGEYDEDVLILLKSVDIVSQHGAAETTVSSIAFTADAWHSCQGSVVGFTITGGLSAGSVTMFVLRDCEIFKPVSIWAEQPMTSEIDVHSCILRSGLDVSTRYTASVSDCEVLHGGIGVGYGYSVSVSGCNVAEGGVGIWGDICGMASCVIENGSAHIQANMGAQAYYNTVSSGNLEVDVEGMEDYSYAAAVGNIISDGGITISTGAYYLVVDDNSVYGCAGEGIAVEWQWDGFVDCSRNVVALCDRGITWSDPPDSADFLCNDVWQNPGGNWIGIPDPTGTNGNISLDPLFCDPAEGDLTLASDSPCLPGNPGNGGCGQIGALGLGCEYASIVPEIAWPAALFLGRPAPNPFAEETVLSYSVPAPDRLTRVRLDIVDPSGRVVRDLVDGVAGPGTCRVRWNGLDDRGAALPSGIYWSRLRVGDRETSERIVRVR